MLVVSRPNCLLEHDDDCRFRIAWKINPHMQIGATNHVRAIEQHAAFVSTLRAVGARVLQLPFIHGAFDSVFMKDSALLRADDRGTQLLPATARFMQRAMEPALRAQQLARAGIRVATPSPFAFEGGDVVLTAGNVAIMGYGIRTELRSASHLEHFLGCEVVPVRLRDESLFHLDVALTALSSGAIVLCEEAFDAPSLRALARLPCPRLVTIELADALKFSLNVIEVDRTIVTGTRSDWMDEVWSSLGYAVRYSPLDQFQLAGGSAACLVAQIYEHPARLAAAA